MSSGEDNAEMSARSRAEPAGADASAEDREQLWLQSARQRVVETVAAIASLGPALGDSFVDAVALIRRSGGKVITIGVGTSGPIARRMAHLLSTSGTPAFYLHPGDALHGALGVVTADDVIIAISKGGESSEMNDFVERALRRGSPTIALTAKPQSRLGRLASVIVRLPDVRGSDPGGVIAMGSSLLAATWGDALAIVLMQISRYGWDRVLDAHPSGAVGELRRLPEPLPALPDIAPEEPAS